MAPYSIFSYLFTGIVAMSTFTTATMLHVDTGCIVFSPPSSPDDNLVPMCGEYDLGDFDGSFALAIYGCFDSSETTIEWVQPGCETGTAIFPGDFGDVYYHQADGCVYDIWGNTYGCTDVTYFDSDFVVPNPWYIEGTPVPLSSTYAASQATGIPRRW